MSEPWDWAVVQQAAVEWMAEHDKLPERMFVPVNTNQGLIDMAGDIYDVEVVRWPVPGPMFGNDRPKGQACPDRSIESTIAVLNGEPNSRGLPFPLYSDIRQRDWQFEFVSQKEADLRARRIYQITDWTMRQLLLWAVVQRVVPHISKSRFTEYCQSLGMSGLTELDHEYVASLLWVKDKQDKRQHNQHAVGDLWIVTDWPASRLLPEPVMRALQPKIISGGRDHNMRGNDFGPDDRIFFYQWNPAKQLEIVSMYRVPASILPMHQLGPTTHCDCLLCEHGGFMDATWQGMFNRSRLSRQDPSQQFIPRQDRKFLLDGGTLDLGISTERIQAMGMSEYAYFREQLLAEARFTRPPLGKITDITST